MTSLAETRRLTGWSRQPEPDALEDEGLWSEPISSTGCEVMRPSRLHAKDGLTLRIPNAKGDAQRQNERARQRPQRQPRARRGALARDSVSGRWRVKVASLPAPLRFAPLRG